MDSHRPWHHENIDENAKNLILIDDNQIDKKNCPNKEDFLMLEEEDNEENVLEFEDEIENYKADDLNEQDKKILENLKNYDGQEEIDQEKSLHEENKEKEVLEDEKISEIIDLVEKSEKTSQKNEKISEIIDLVEKSEKTSQNNEKIENNENQKIINEEQDEIIIGQKRIQRKIQKKKEKQEMRKKTLEKIENYYKGSYSGNSITGILYQLCQQLNKENQNLLWFWILGLTDQRLNYRINNSVYEKRALIIQREVMRMNFQNNGSTSFFDKKNIGNITCERKLDLILLNYWNLYECLMYSNSTIPKLKSWHEMGKIKLQELILKLGIPLEESKQLFTYLEPKYKQDLEEKVVKIANQFDLEDILITQFQNKLDHKNSYLSQDFCFLCNKVLNCPKNFFNQVINITEEEKEEQNIFQSNRDENFWFVYDELLENNIKNIEEAIKYSIDFQKEAVQLAFDLLAQNQIKQCSSFSYAVLSFENLSQKISITYLLLEEIANLIIQIKFEILKLIYQRENKSTKPKIKPLVLSIFDQKKNCYYVLGSNGIDNTNSSLTIKKKQFKKLFWKQIQKFC